MRFSVLTMLLGVCLIGGRAAAADGPASDDGLSPFDVFTDFREAYEERWRPYTWEQEYRCHYFDPTSYKSEVAEVAFKRDFLASAFSDTTLAFDSTYIAEDLDETAQFAADQLLKLFAVSESRAVHDGASIRSYALPSGLYRRTHNNAQLTSNAPSAYERDFGIELIESAFPITSEVLLEPDSPTVIVTFNAVGLR